MESYYLFIPFPSTELFGIYITTMMFDQLESAEGPTYLIGYILGILFCRQFIIIIVSLGAVNSRAVAQPG